MPSYEAVKKHLEAQALAIKTAPIPFFAAIIVAVIFIWTAIWLAMDWRYSAIIESKDAKITTLSDENARIRVALGVDPATPNALLSLNNKELKAKTMSVVAKLREIDRQNQDQQAAIMKLPNLDEQKKNDRIDALLKELDQQYVKDIKSDAFNLDFELRRRLGPQAVAGIVGITPSIVARDGTRIDILQLATMSNFPPVDLGFVTPLAYGLEQMVKLLPENG